MLSTRFLRASAAALPEEESWPNAAAQLRKKHQAAFFISEFQSIRTVC
jgi:hypothetical protein